MLYWNLSNWLCCVGRLVLVECGWADGRDRAEGTEVGVEVGAEVEVGVGAEAGVEAGAEAEVEVGAEGGGEAAVLIV